MRKWTAEQQNAIDAENRSIIVSAAAGSGKTSVLVQRLIRIISDSSRRIPVEKMVVVTFTNDAAAEMKMRLSSSLSEMLRSNPEDRWLSRQRSLIGSAKISTIHSFCFGLLRENISELDITFGFRIAEPSEERIFKEKALQIIFEEFYSKYPEDMKFLNDCFCTVSDKPLENMIFSLYDQIMSIPFYDKWFENLFKTYENGSVYLEDFNEYVGGRLEDIDYMLKGISSLASDYGQQKLIDAVDTDIMGFSVIRKLFEKGEYIEFAKAISAFKFTRMPNPAKNSGDESIRAVIKANRDSCKNAVQKLVKKDVVNLYAYINEDLELHKKAAAIIKRIIDNMAHELWKIKVSKNTICFDDAEQLTLELLTERNQEGKVVKSALAKEISDYYEIIMVDEFQDTNNRQDMIFRLISKGGNTEKYGSNLFMVGDVKQSIYRFRLANPDNFIKAVSSAVPYEKGGTENTCIKLNQNFRSSSEVIEFANYVFSHIMTGKAGDVDYNEDEYLIQGASFPEGNRNTKILLFEDDKNSAEEKYTAIQIKRILDEKTPVSDGKGGTRPCEYRDFCILIRNRDKAEGFARELESRGIPSYYEEMAGYIKSREIAVLLNILRIVDNPLNDTALMSVMLSPMFMMTAQEAAEIRLIDKNASVYKNILAGIGASGSEPLLSGELYIKAKFLYDTVTQLRMYAVAYTLRELISRIYDSTDFLSVMQIYKDSAKKKANLRMLLEYAESYESGTKGGLSGFIRYIDRISESGGDLETTVKVSGSQNVVSIKTMHKSKGLEYPFVFIVAVSTTFKGDDVKLPYRFSADRGLGFKFQNKEKYEKYATMPFAAVEAYNYGRTVSEEMRLFYVAVTRAKERLFITYEIDKNEDSSKNLNIRQYNFDMKLSGGITHRIVGNARSIGDWLSMVLPAHRKSGLMRKISGTADSAFMFDEDFEIEYELYEPEEEEVLPEKELEKTALPDLTVTDELKRNFAFKYDHRFSQLTAKLSVSDVSKDDEAYGIRLSHPHFSGGKRLTGAEKGTALHTFLQYADFDSTKRDVESEIERLKSGGYLTDLQAEAVKAEDVKAFLRSGIFKRMENAVSVIREKKFLIAIDDMELDGELGEIYKGTTGMLNGIIDVVIEEEDGLVLADYKTDYVKEPEELIEKYSKQLMLYKHTLEKIGSKPVKQALIYSFHFGREIEIF